ncbi:ATP-binding cassette domain-containing protein [Streptomyces sp. NPDC001927]
MSYAVRAEGLVKRYGDTVALDGFDLAVRPGEVVALLGPQGAGRTTALRVLAALDRPDAGRATVCGHDVVREGARVRELIWGMEWPAGGREAGDLLGSPRVLLLDEPDAALLWNVVGHRAAEGTAVLFTTRHPAEADGLADRVTVLDGGRVVAEGPPEELKRRLGDPSLRVRPSLAGDGDAVQRILTELTGAVPSHDRHTGLFSAPATDPMLLSALVRRLERAGVGTEEVGLRRPDLEEVVTALTAGAGSVRPRYPAVPRSR